MKKIVLILTILAVSCSAPDPSAQEIIDSAIKASGTKKMKNATASFIFRNIKYDYQYRNDHSRYIRTQINKEGNEVKDVVVNSKLNRFINDSLVVLEEEKKAAYFSSINSVIYFAFLPLWLNDDAVIKEYVGTIDLKGRKYYKIKVTFQAEGGGEDHEDVFYYWFETDDYSMDYLAYSYNEDEGKGIRFREAYNSRVINGVVIQDYRNYKPSNQNNFALETIDQAFVDNQLALLSLIALEDMEIRQ